MFLNQKVIFIREMCRNTQGSQWEIAKMHSGLCSPDVNVKDVWNVSIRPIFPCTKGFSFSVLLNFYIDIYLLLVLSFFLLGV